MTAINIAVPADQPGTEVYAAAPLGVPPQTDEPYYVGFEAEGRHIGRDASLII